MSDTPTKPRPRPKPKPRQKVSSPQEPNVVVDGDDMFIKNRTRTVTTWAKLDDIQKEKPRKRSNDSDSGTDNDSVVSPRGRRYKKKKQGNELPRWQRDKDFVRLLSQDLSDDSDSDGVEILGSSTPGGSKAQRKGKGKARSRSITPPPALPLHQIQNAREVVRRALDIVPREPSPPVIEIDADESTDTIILAPELAQIANAINAQPKLHVPAAHTSADTVVLSVKWQPHPLNTGGEENVWDFKMNRDDNFRDLFEAVAEEAEIMSETLILSYEGKRIFSSVTPMTLNIWGRAELVACDKTTYEYIRKNPETTHHTFTYSQSQPQTHAPTSKNDTDVINIDSDNENDIGVSGPAPSSPQADYPPETQSDAGSDDGDKFKLVLRSALTVGHDIALTVRPTTKCGAIVRAFLKKAGLQDQYPAAFGLEASAPASAVKKRGRQSKAAATPPQKNPQLLMDGEKLSNESEIGDMDLEDGDLVEVVGL
ncbi:hypothetical protein BDQ17DRAFT_1342970 [Cyathus striatus]|nr:hypothetical protein BDQ17DRAFT_1342970 [Cyathus striatus]